MPYDDAKQFREGDRLADELRDPQPLGILLIPSTGAHDHDRNLGNLRILELPPPEGHSVHEWHPQIEQDQAGFGL